MIKDAGRTLRVSKTYLCVQFVAVCTVGASSKRHLLKVHSSRYGKDKKAKSIRLEIVVACTEITVPRFVQTKTKTKINGKH